MDIHRRTVAILHIISGVLLLGITLCVALFFGALFGGSHGGHASGFFGFAAGVGALIVIPFLLLALAQIYAATAFLRGNQTAGTFLVVFGVLSLFNFPLGTAVGIYTIWVLLIREKSSGAPA